MKEVPGFQRKYQPVTNRTVTVVVGIEIYAFCQARATVRLLKVNLDIFGVIFEVRTKSQRLKGS